MSNQSICTPVSPAHAAVGHDGTPHGSDSTRFDSESIENKLRKCGFVPSSGWHTSKMESADALDNYGQTFVADWHREFRIDRYGMFVSPVGLEHDMRVFHGLVKRREVVCVNSVDARAAVMAFLQTEEEDQTTMSDAVLDRYKHAARAQCVCMPENWHCMTHSSGTWATADELLRQGIEPNPGPGDTYFEEMRACPGYDVVDHALITGHWAFVGVELNPGPNAKGELQEMTAARRAAPPVYTTMSRTGPDHAPSFTVRCDALGQRATSASFPSIGECEQDAAARVIMLVGPATSTTAGAFSATSDGPRVDTRSNPDLSALLTAVIEEHGKQATEVAALRAEIDKLRSANVSLRSALAVVKAALVGVELNPGPGGLTEDALKAVAREVKGMPGSEAMAVVTQAIEGGEWCDGDSVTMAAFVTSLRNLDLSKPDTVAVAARRALPVLMFKNVAMIDPVNQAAAVNALVQIASMDGADVSALFGVWNAIVMRAAITDAELWKLLDRMCGTTRVEGGSTTHGSGGTGGGGGGSDKPPVPKPSASEKLIAQLQSRGFGKATSPATAWKEARVVRAMAVGLRMASQFIRFVCETVFNAPQYRGPVEWLIRAPAAPRGILPIAIGCAVLVCCNMSDAFDDDGVSEMASTAYDECCRVANVEAGASRAEAWNTIMHALNGNGETGRTAARVYIVPVGRGAESKLMPHMTDEDRVMLSRRTNDGWNRAMLNAAERMIKSGVQNVAVPLRGTTTVTGAVDARSATPQALATLIAETNNQVAQMPATRPAGPIGHDVAALLKSLVTGPASSFKVTGNTAGPGWSAAKKGESMAEVLARKGAIGPMDQPTRRHDVGYAIAQAYEKSGDKATAQKVREAFDGLLVNDLKAIPEESMGDEMRKAAMQATFGGLSVKGVQLPGAMEAVRMEGRFTPTDEQLQQWLAKYYESIGATEFDKKILSDTVFKPGSEKSTLETSAPAAQAAPTFSGPVVENGDVKLKTDVKYGSGMDTTKKEAVGFQPLDNAVVKLAGIGSDGQLHFHIPFVGRVNTAMGEKYVRVGDFVDGRFDRVVDRWAADNGIKAGPMRALVTQAIDLTKPDAAQAATSAASAAVAGSEDAARAPDSRAESQAEGLVGVEPNPGPGMSLSHKAWNKLMHALNGNTETSAPTAFDQALGGAAVTAMLAAGRTTDWTDDVAAFERGQASLQRRCAQTASYFTNSGLGLYPDGPLATLHVGDVFNNANSVPYPDVDVTGCANMVLDRLANGGVPTPIGPLPTTQLVEWQSTNPIVYNLKTCAQLDDIVARGKEAGFDNYAATLRTGNLLAGQDLNSLVKLVRGGDALGFLRDGLSGARLGWYGPLANAYAVRDLDTANEYWVPQALSMINNATNVGVLNATLVPVPVGGAPAAVFSVITLSSWISLMTFTGQTFVNAATGLTYMIAGFVALNGCSITSTTTISPNVDNSGVAGEIAVAVSQLAGPLIRKEQVINEANFVPVDWTFASPYDRIDWLDKQTPNIGWAKSTSAAAPIPWYGVISGWYAAGAPVAAMGAQAVSCNNAIGLAALNVLPAAQLANASVWCMNYSTAFRFAGWASAITSRAMQFGTTGALASAIPRIIGATTWFATGGTGCVVEGAAGAVIPFLRPSVPTVFVAAWYRNVYARACNVTGDTTMVMYETSRTAFESWLRPLFEMGLFLNSGMKMGASTVPSSIDISPTAMRSIICDAWTTGSALEACCAGLVTPTALTTSPALGALVTQLWTSQANSPGAVARRTAAAMNTLFAIKLNSLFADMSPMAITNALVLAATTIGQTYGILWPTTYARWHSDMLGVNALQFGLEAQKSGTRPFTVWTDAYGLMKRRVLTSAGVGTLQCGVVNAYTEEDSGKPAALVAKVSGQRTRARWHEALRTCTVAAPAAGLLAADFILWEWQCQLGGAPVEQSGMAVVNNLTAWAAWLVALAGAADFQLPAGAFATPTGASWGAFPRCIMPWWRYNIQMIGAQALGSVFGTSCSATGRTFGNVAGTSAHTSCMTSVVIGGTGMDTGQVATSNVQTGDVLRAILGSDFEEMTDEVPDDTTVAPASSVGLAATGDALAPPSSTPPGQTAADAAAPAK